MKTCYVSVILLTAKKTFQSKMDRLEMGVGAYIEKPFSPEYLHLQIANLHINRNKIKEYFSHSPITHIRSMAHTKADEQFVEKVHEIVSAHLSDTEMDVEHPARYLNMSRPTLYRKLKEISDLTPSELINITRLKKSSHIVGRREFICEPGGGDGGVYIS